MAGLLSTRRLFRAGIGLWCAAGVLLLAPTAIPQGDAGQLLTQAERLAFLYNWLDAGPVFARAETLFAQAGDQRNELYARVGRMRGEIETRSLPDFARYLADLLNQPVTQQDPRLRLLCLIAKGDIDFQVDLAASRRDWEEVRSLAKTLNEPRWVNRAEGELGTIKFFEGEIFQSLRLVGSALLAAKTSGDTAAYIRYGSALGEGFGEFGRSKDALEFFERAIELAKNTPGMGVPFTASLGKARMLILLSRKEEGRRLLEQGIREARAGHWQVRLTRLLIALGNFYASEGETTAAISYFTEAAAIAKEQRLYRLLSASAGKLAVLYAQRDNNPTQAAAYAQASVTASKQGGDLYHLPERLAAVAQLQTRQGHYLEADHTYEQASSLIDDLLTNVPDFADKNVLIGTMSTVYLGHFGLAIHQLHNAGKAFRILEQARGRGMADFLRSLPAQGKPGPSREAAGSQISASLQLELKEEPGPRRRELLLSRLWENERRSTTLEHVKDRWRGLARANPVHIASLQASLAPGELVLEYGLDESRSVSLAISRDHIDYFPVPARKQIDMLVDSYLQQLATRQQGQDLGRQLYEALLAPAMGNEAKQLIIIPDGRLQLLPFEALIDKDGRYLLESHVVSYSPSATVFHLLRTASFEHSATQPFLGIGGVTYHRASLQTGKADLLRANRGLFQPGGAPDFQPLPGAQEEVIDLAEIIGSRGKALTGPRATESALKAQPLAQFQIVHFAVHGVASQDHPDRASLVLGDEGHTQEDGLLQAWEVTSLPLHAELVTLSSCEANLGRIEGAAGIANLVQSFLFAGARSVVASSWDVDDTFTAKLMRQFYVHLRQGQGKATALQQAKLDLLRQFGKQAVPFYWAGFRLTGEGANAIPLGKK